MKNVIVGPDTQPAAASVRLSPCSVRACICFKTVVCCSYAHSTTLNIGPCTYWVSHSKCYTINYQWQSSHKYATFHHVFLCQLHQARVGVGGGSGHGTSTGGEAGNEVTN